MSSDAQAVVRVYCDRVIAWDVPGMTEILDPDIVWFGTRGGLDERQVLRGRQAVLDYTTEIREAWEQLDYAVDRVIDAGGDTVVVFFRETGRTSHGDLEVETETAVIFKVREGRITEATGYLDRDEALRAAGLAD